MLVTSFRFGRDTTKTMVECTGSQGVFYESLRTDALNKAASHPEAKLSGTALGRQDTARVFFSPVPPHSPPY